MAMERAKIAILISGAGTNMAALLYASRADDCPYEVVLVASNVADAGGIALAAAEGIATAVHPHKGLGHAEHDGQMHASIIAAGAHYVVLAGYMRILTDGFVQQWQDRMVNIHPSLLPKYPGLDTHQRAIDAGDSHGGCTVHLVTPELDNGPVLGQTKVAIAPGDTAETLAARVLIAEHQLYNRCVARWVSRASDPEWLLDQVRARAMAQMEADEVVSHGMACFGITGGKKFAYFSKDHHGDGRVALLVKISGGEEQAMLIDNDEQRYFRPAYFGDNWIGIRLDLGDNDWDAIDDWLGRSWRSVAPKKLTKLLDAADAF